MKKYIRSIFAIAVMLMFVISLSACTTPANYDSENSDSEVTSSSSYNSGYNSGYNSYDSDDDFKNDVDDWMKDQAAGKDYNYDDGGSYYCMGKGDTCNNKTKNRYDLYCNSCDPNGDNIEG